LEGPKS